MPPDGDSPLPISEEIRRPPQVKRGCRPVRGPSLAVPCQLIRFRQFPFAVGDLESAPDAEIVDWEHVWSPEVENEEHLDGPSPNSFDRGEPIQNLGIGI